MVQLLATHFEFNTVPTWFARYGEWSRAVWSLQRKHLETNAGFDWRYVGFFQEHDSLTADEWKKYIGGTMNSDACLFLDLFSLRFEHRNRQWIHYGTDQWIHCFIPRSIGIPARKLGLQAGPKPGLKSPSRQWRFVLSLTRSCRYLPCDPPQLMFGFEAEAVQISILSLGSHPTSDAPEASCRRRGQIGKPSWAIASLGEEFQCKPFNFLACVIEERPSFNSCCTSSCNRSWTPESKSHHVPAHLHASQCACQPFAVWSSFSDCRLARLSIKRVFWLMVFIDWLDDVCFHDFPCVVWKW